MSDELYRLYFDISQAIIVVLDVQGRIEDLNPAACELLGVERDEAIGEDWFERFITEDERERVREVFRKIMRGDLEPVKEFENEVVTSSGERRVVNWRNAYLKDEKGRIVGTFSTGVDVTEARKAVTVLEKTERFYEFLVGLTHYVLHAGWCDEIFPFFLTKIVEAFQDADAGSLVVKKGNTLRFAATVGYDLEKLKSVEFTPQDAAWMPEKPTVVRWREIALNGVKKRILSRYGRRSEIESSLVIPLFRNSEFVGYITLDNFSSPSAFDETDLKIAEVFQGNMKVLLWKDEMEKKTKYMLDHDVLTDALTRRAFYERAEKLLKLAKRHGWPLGFVYMDIDGFKTINDIYGHDYGDRILVAFSKRVKGLIRSSDEFGRIGGDEFVILLPETDEKGVLKFKQRLEDGFKTPVRFDGGSYTLSVSVGHSCFPEDGETVGDLLKVADKRMYEEKERKKGGNRS